MLSLVQGEHLGFHGAGIDCDPGNADRKSKPPGSGGPGIQIEHTISNLLGPFVGMPEDYRRKAAVCRIEVEVRKIVEHEDPDILDLHHGR